MDFLPSTLDGWLALLVQIGALLLGAWGVMVRFIRKPLVDQIISVESRVVEQINGVGTRVKMLELTDAVHSGKLEVIERHDERREFQHDAIRERVAKVEGDHQKLHEQVITVTSQLKERLASMEGTLRFIARQVGGREQA